MKLRTIGILFICIGVVFLLMGAVTDPLLKNTFAVAVVVILNAFLIWLWHTEKE